MGSKFVKKYSKTVLENRRLSAKILGGFQTPKWSQKGGKMEAKVMRKPPLTEKHENAKIDGGLKRKPSF